MARRRCFLLACYCGPLVRPRANAKAPCLSAEYPAGDCRLHCPIFLECGMCVLSVGGGVVACDCWWRGKERERLSNESQDIFCVVAHVSCCTLPLSIHIPVALDAVLGVSSLVICTTHTASPSAVGSFLVSLPPVFAACINITFLNQQIIARIISLLVRVNSRGIYCIILQFRAIRLVLGLAMTWRVAEDKSKHNKVRRGL